MWTADVASTWNTSTLKKASSPEWQTCHVADGRTADCIIYTHLLPAAAFGRYTCSVRLSEMIYDGPFAYMKRIDYWGAFSPYLRVSLLSLWKVSYRPSDESRRSFCQPYPDIGGRPHLTTRYDWNILTGTMDFIRNYVNRNILSVRMPLRVSSHNKMLFKSDNILFDKELVFL